MCALEKIMFTGDTLLKGIKSKVTQPDGNREELRQSILHIYEIMPGDIQYSLVMGNHLF